MHIEIFKLKLVNTKNDFIHFSAASFNNLAITSVHALKAESQDGSVFYFSPYHSPNGSLDDDCIGISAFYARALGLREDQHLVISTINNLGSIRRLHVSPWTADDLEIVCSSSSVIESQLLSQLRIVWPNQVFCAWISNNISFNLVVDSLTPELQYGRLEEYTEIVVNVEPKKNAVASTNPRKSAYLSRYRNVNEENSLVTIHCRCIPIDDPIKLFFKLNKVPPFAVYTLKSKQHIPDTCQLWKLVKTDNENAPLEVFVQLYQVDHGSFRKSKWTELLISESVASHLNVKLGAKVDLVPLKNATSKEDISAMLISPRFTFSNSEEDQQLLIKEVRDSLMDYALCHASFLLNNKGEITLRSGRKVQLTLRPLSIHWSFISIATLQNVSFSCNEYHSEGFRNSQYSEISEGDNIWKYLIDHDELKLIERLARSDGPNAHLQANLLITGKSGSGKTELCKSLMNTLSKGPFYFHLVNIDCLKLKGKRIEVVVRDLNDTVKEAVDHQPSVIVLENIDNIASRPDADHVGTEATLFSNRIAHKLAQVLEECQRLHSISFVGTALSASCVHPRIYAVRGNSLFTSNVQMPEHNKESRKKILNHLISKKAPASKLHDLELDRFARITEGFLIVDLVKLIKTALFEAWQRKVQEQEVDLQITNDDLFFAINCTKPSYLEGIDLLKEKKHSWATVGGLKEAKAKITEVIIWPTLYPHVLKQCPLKAQTGILLYGAPGTGKTILARAAAFESSLNFITVKGPELMSKYIGQSEEGVRNVFEKAQSAKPCLLFFDEFESLAPRRGKDQTGVTDRVVNQLLTALDGVEPLTGVFVMAATSRPDLIDPALLRPGRIGTSVHCTFPDTATRAEILSALSTNIELDEDVDFSIVAEATIGFSGADLKGLLSSAQLKVIDQIISESSLAGDQLQEASSFILERHQNVKLKQDHILDALKDCKPSLGRAEKRKYDKIYNNFLKPSFIDMNEQKVTLA